MRQPTAGARSTVRPSAPPRTEELQRIHPAWFLDALDAAAEPWGRLDRRRHLRRAGSMAAARLAAGATIAAASAAAAGAATVAFAVVRPPGHHASEERAAGFCLLNNVAIAAAALRAERPARSASPSSTGTCTTATGRRRSSMPTRTSATPRPTNRPSIPEPAARPRAGAGRRSAPSTTCRCRRERRPPVHRGLAGAAAAGDRGFRAGGDPGVRRLSTHMCRRPAGHARGDRAGLRRR